MLAAQPVLTRSTEGLGWGPRGSDPAELSPGSINQWGASRAAAAVGRAGLLRAPWGSTRAISGLLRAAHRASKALGLDMGW